MVFFGRQKPLPRGLGKMSLEQLMFSHAVSSQSSKLGIAS